MRYFLLVYDTQSGDLGEIEEFASAHLAEAMSRRYEVEAAHRFEPEVEVVLLGAPSLEHLRVTHSRYFMTPQEMLANAGR